jgi:hypothetical protein
MKCKKSEKEKKDVAHLENAEGGNKNCIRNGKELMLMDLYKYYF